jgi:hypothetical protein
MFDMFKSKTPVQRAHEKMALEKLLLKGGTRTSREIRRESQDFSRDVFQPYGEVVRHALNQRTPYHPSQRRAAERAFAKRIAASQPAPKPKSARQERMARKLANRIANAQREKAAA